MIDKTEVFRKSPIEQIRVVYKKDTCECQLWKRVKKQWQLDQNIIIQIGDALGIIQESERVAADVSDLMDRINALDPNSPQLLKDMLHEELALLQKQIAILTEASEREVLAWRGRLYDAMETLMR